ncbi:hypothetical protein GMORB2_2624 [Geosmithia morbida]|uniref:BZIP domain-containing protein n=1 Tax=Geosmithia morbida TaxID=1094350 RepID=A0A9P4YP97_9HYPO|nr:uncharacterized protein GMORB2_2624 [Geosmithia morbida]KAF4120621.1 hypothetical protein GMORB2_2624 [Geosmithia morbida]
MSTLADQMVHPAIHLDDLMDLSGDPTSDMADPHLAMPFFGNLSGKESDQLTVDPSTWGNSLDPNPFADSPEDYTTTNPRINNASTIAVDDGALELQVADAASPRRTARTTRIQGKSSRTLSKSSIPSLSSGPSSPGAKPARAIRATKKQEPRAGKTAKANPSAPSRSTRARKRERQPSEDDVDGGGGIAGGEGGDFKRTKYLERNRIAASKCRQKKKAWVCDLETQKCELEVMHSSLQRDYTSLIDEINQLKTDLMNHAGCGDPNIDDWINAEAKRFVVKKTKDDPEPAPAATLVDDDNDDDNQQFSLAAGDLFDNDPSMVGQSPTLSDSIFAMSPVIKNEEDINYDHMPDDMFQ